MSKITQSARGEECQIRLINVCNRNNETVVFAHLNGGGMGTKKSDLQGSYACSSCHDAVDGRIKTIYSADYLELSFRQGVERTQNIIKLKGFVVIT